MKRTLALIALTVVVGAVLFAGAAWLWRDDGGVSIHGYIALGLGVLVSAGLGGGLMALAFHSSRHGWDEDDREP